MTNIHNEKKYNQKSKSSRRRNKIVGVTFGAFDLCHAGHVRMLRDAKQHCEHLIVGLHDDPSRYSDKKYRMDTGGKLKNTPIMSIEERREILEAIKYVDEIFIYSTENDLLDWLKNNDYDLRIIGSDWKGKKYTGWDLPHTPYFHTRDHGYSTSELRERIYKAESSRIQQTSGYIAPVQTSVRQKSSM